MLVVDARVIHSQGYEQPAWRKPFAHYIEARFVVRLVGLVHSLERLGLQDEY